MQTVERIYFRESGMGIGQTFWWDRASRTVRVEDEEKLLGPWSPISRGRRLSIIHKADGRGHLSNRHVVRFIQCREMA